MFGFVKFSYAFGAFSYKSAIVFYFFTTTH